jgi:L-fuculose-phosphate aldolase
MIFVPVHRARILSYAALPSLLTFSFWKSREKCMKWVNERQELIATVRGMNALGINHGSSGNASVRVEGGYLVTPSGMAYEDLEPDDIVMMTMEREVSGLHNPSSEWRFHRDLYTARPEFGAIVHTHGRAVMTVACQRRGIPPFHYMIALAGGHNIRCAEYATFGTQTLSNNALDAMRGRKACLLANHGLLVGEISLKKALALAVEIETLCDTYWRTLQIGDPILLTEQEMQDVLNRFAKGYGNAPKEENE